MTTKNDFKKQYTEFSENIAIAVRTWHYHIHLNNRASVDASILATLNKAPRYWLDQRYCAVQATIIFLGKIFDSDSDAHNVDKTLRAAKEEKEYFSRTELRKRKVELAGEFEGIDEYIDNSNELNKDDLKAISAEIKKAKNIWRLIKPLRDKIYAHNQVLSDVERKELYDAVKNSDINDILQILLNVSNALWQAEVNGHKPDFSFNYTQPIKEAKKEIEKLIDSLCDSQAIKSTKA